MLTSKIRCLVIRVPEDDRPIPPRAAWREALPWADPYILGLIRKLQREVREERAAQFAAEREARALSDRIDQPRYAEAVQEEVLDPAEFTAEEWNESIRTGPRKSK